MLSLVLDRLVFSGDNLTVKGGPKPGPRQKCGKKQKKEKRSHCFSAVECVRPAGRRRRSPSRRRPARTGSPPGGSSHARCLRPRGARHLQRVAAPPGSPPTAASRSSSWGACRFSLWELAALVEGCAVCAWSPMRSGSQERRKIKGKGEVRRKGSGLCGSHRPE
jgi:hypothetical protein